MQWETLKPWKEILETLKFAVLTSPKKLKAIKFSDIEPIDCYALCSDGNRPIAVHLFTDSIASPAEMHRTLRRAYYSHHAALSPCILSIGSPESFGIYIINDNEEDAFQCINLTDTGAGTQELLQDFRTAANKTTVPEKIHALYKALDYEALSRRFFEKAKLCKEVFEEDIFSSTKLARSEENIQDVSHYSIVVMARMIFLHFLEKKRLLNYDENYLRLQLLGDSDSDLEPVKKLWTNLFQPLFETLNKNDSMRAKSPLSKHDFPYLNGGLFAPYEKIEDRASFSKLKISDEAIRDFHRDCLYKYRIVPREEKDHSVARGVLDPELLGTIFEKFMKDDVSASTGSVYTPKDVVLFIVRNALTRHFEMMGLPEKTAFDLVHKYDVSQQFADRADQAFISLKLIDPCCGSGAFLLTALQELFEIKRAIRQGQGKERWHNGDKRRAYEEILGNNLFGLDINPEAIILCHLRLWLPIIDLIDGKSNYSKINPLPNLGLNFRCGNSLINPRGDWESHSWSQKDAKALAEIRMQYFKASAEGLSDIKEQFDEIANQDDGFVRLSRNFIDVRFGKGNGFDLVIGNPPYLGLKDTQKIGYLKDWKQLTGQDISDMYIMFTKESYRIVKENGCIAYVTSNTYFTDSGKESFRKLLIGGSKEFPSDRLQIVELSPKTFHGVGVRPALFIINRRNQKSTAANTIQVVHCGSKDKSVNGHLVELNDEPEKYSRRDGEGIKHIFTDIPRETIQKIPASNLFIPNPERLRFLKEFGAKWRSVYDEVWPLIKTSRLAEANSGQTHLLRSKLKPYDVTIVGLVAEGGQGLATACNTVHLAVLDGTKEAEKIKKKIAEAKTALQKGNAVGAKTAKGQQKIKEVVANLRNHGHPYATAEFDFVHKIITSDQVFDVSKLDEKDLDHIRYHGISKNLAKKHGVKYPCYVPYYKGQDSDFNRWYQELTTYIDWSEENVSWMKSVSGKKFTGAPVVRNPQFYFERGFCWNLIRTSSVQSRWFSERGVNDVGCMKLSSLSPTIDDLFITAVVNSSISGIAISILTNTVNTQINDIKLLPLVVPDYHSNSAVSQLVTKIIKVITDKKLNLSEKKSQVDDLEREIDDIIASLYLRAADDQPAA